MSERDFEIGSRKFKLNKIEAFKQFHIVRRIGPILADMLPALSEIQASAKAAKGAEQSFDGLAKIALPVMSGLSKLSDADADRVLFGLLSSVEMQQASGNWARVSSDSMLMIQDLELPVLLQAAGKAFAFNLSGFFAGLPAKS